MHAYVDESLRQGPTGLYVVATVVITGDRDHARNVARSVLLRRQPRYHWHAESEPQRHRMLEAITGLDVRVLAYACRPVAPSKTERARALCIGRLLWDLVAEDDLGNVDELVLESRQEHNDRKDRKIIAAAQRAHRAPASLRYSHAQPSAEPLLWLPDAVAGAVSAHVAGETSRYLEALGERVQLVDLAP